MRQKRIWIGIALLCTMIQCPAVWSQEEAATKEECIAKVTQAVNQIKAEGFEAVKPVIEKIGGPYTWKDGYVFVMDTKEGIMLAHPFLPSQMVGRPLLNVTDNNGTQYVKEMLDLANKEGQGWVKYLNWRRGYQEPQMKETYVFKVPTADVIVASGYFPQKDQ
ncbi:cache domain-containing protein [uncultured Desulfosarcina sp.]|uniref:cache domain-containing protein n=1 Tax=uncultured Desulfosarcina sp. TaxID=218289 RepID=UPI0029C88691|nr:cache domain-containing protein [uncultured Desulfosarcina sp.]